MLDGEYRGVHFLAHLNLIPAVDEQHRAVREHDGQSGRAGEAGEPREPLGARRYVFVLIAVGARHDVAVESAALKFRAQRRHARRGFTTIVAIVERLEQCFEHRRNLSMIPENGNRIAARIDANKQSGAAAQNCFAPRLRPSRETSVVQPSSSMRRLSASGRYAAMHRVGLRGQHPGQHDAAAARGQRAQRSCEPQQRSEQDVGEYQVERRARAQRLRRDAVAGYHFDHRTGAIEPRVARATRTAVASMSVASTRALQCARGGDGEHAAAGAEIEDAQRHAEPFCYSASSASRQPRVVP